MRRTFSQGASPEARQGLETLLMKVQEQDLENLRLQRRSQRLAQLELVIRNLAPVDGTARELLKVLEESCGTA